MSGGPFSVREADSDQYILQVAGVNIAQGAGQSGYTDGEFFSCEQARESFIVVEGTDGSITRTKTNTRLLNMKINLSQSAARNALLSAIVISGENGVNGADIGSFVLKDLQGTTLVQCSRSWISKRPSIALDRSSKERVWTLQGVWDVFLVGGN
jgi:hypothetical protein